MSEALQVARRFFATLLIINASMTCGHDVARPLLAGWAQPTTPSKPVLVTVCELPHHQSQLAPAWDDLREHVFIERSELVLLPEFSFAEALWESEFFDAERWSAVETGSDKWLGRLSELGAEFVVGTRPVTLGKSCYNEGFLWSRRGGYFHLRRKHYLPNEPGGWEANWMSPGEPDFRAFQVGSLSIGLNICTELWALESYAKYSAMGLGAILAPRATASDTTSKWLSVGTVAAVRSGAYCLSSNRVDPSGSCGGVGWIISPDGELIARTSRQSPFCTSDIDVSVTRTSGRTYRRYVLSPVRRSGVTGHHRGVTAAEACQQLD